MHTTQANSFLASKGEQGRPVLLQAASIWCILAPAVDDVAVFIGASWVLSRQLNMAQLPYLRSATSHLVYSTVQVSGQVNLLRK